MACKVKDILWGVKIKMENGHQKNENVDQDEKKKNIIAQNKNSLANLYLSNNNEFFHITEKELEGLTLYDSDLVKANPSNSLQISVTN